MHHCCTRPPALCSTMSIIDSLNDSWKFDIETSKECQDIEDKLRASFDLQLICPPLPVPATKQQCLDAVERCKKLFVALTKDYREYQELVVRARNEQVKFEVSLHRQFLQHSKPSLYDYPEHTSFKVSDAIYEHRQKVLELNEDWRSDSVQLQRRLHKLVEGQDKELVEWYFAEVMSEFSDHVKIIKPSNITEAAVSDKRGVLPAEIRSLIYSHCDLESCVSLRQVSSEWFLTFQTLERDFKEKLPLRNISIFPGDDFQTWHDCVLVFVARVQKWTSTDSLQTVTYPETKPVKSLLARTSHPGEKVPSNLAALVSAYCRSWDFCPHLHDRLESVRVNLKSFEVEREREWYDLVDREMIRVQDIDITLPPSIPVSHNLTVKVNSMCIVVQSETHTLVVPSDQPHFKHGFLLENEKPASVRELGEVIVVKQEGNRYWELLDLKTKSLIKFYDDYEHLAACYGGAMWLHMGEAECLVPTIYDLQTPGKLYYSQDKIITGVDLLIPFQGSRADGLSQFVVGSRGKVRVADLATAQVTKISGPANKDPAKHTQTIPGFLDGKFQVKVMENKDVNELYRTHFRMDRNTLEWVGG